MSRRVHLGLAPALLLSCLPHAAPGAAVTSAGGALALDLRARVHGAEGTSEIVDVGEESVLRAGDGVQIRVRAERGGYVYVLVHGSSDRVQLAHPYGSAQSGPPPAVSAGAEVVIPGGGLFLPLDARAGQESVYAVWTPEPVDDPAQLVAAVEQSRGDRRAAVATLAARFADAVGQSFAHFEGEGLAGVAPPTSGPGAGAGARAAAPAASAASEELPWRRPQQGAGAAAADGGAQSGVLSASGSKIRSFMGFDYVEQQRPADAPAGPAGSPPESAPAVRAPLPEPPAPAPPQPDARDSGATGPTQAPADQTAAGAEGAVVSADGDGASGGGLLGGVGRLFGVGDEVAAAAGTGPVPGAGTGAAATGATASPEPAARAPEAPDPVPPAAVDASPASVATPPESAATAAPPESAPAAPAGRESGGGFFGALKRLFSDDGVEPPAPASGEAGPEVPASEPSEFTRAFPLPAQPAQSSAAGAPSLEISVAPVGPAGGAQPRLTADAGTGPEREPLAAWSASDPGLAGVISPRDAPVDPPSPDAAPRGAGDDAPPAAAPGAAPVPPADPAAAETAAGGASAGSGPAAERAARRTRTEAPHDTGAGAVPAQAKGPPAGAPVPPEALFAAADPAPGATASGAAPAASDPPVAPAPGAEAAPGASGLSGPRPAETRGDTRAAAADARAPASPVQPETAPARGREQTAGATASAEPEPSAPASPAAGGSGARVSKALFPSWSSAAPAGAEAEEASTPHARADAEPSAVAAPREAEPGGGVLDGLGRRFGIGAGDPPAAGAATALPQAALDTAADSAAGAGSPAPEPDRAGEERSAASAPSEPAATPAAAASPAASARAGDGTAAVSDATTARAAMRARADGPPTQSRVGAAPEPEGSGRGVPPPAAEDAADRGVLATLGTIFGLGAGGAAAPAAGDAAGAGQPADGKAPAALAGSSAEPAAPGAVARAEREADGRAAIEAAEPRVAARAPDPVPEADADAHLDGGLDDGLDVPAAASRAPGPEPPPRESSPPAAAAADATAAEETDIAPSGDAGTGAAAGLTGAGVEPQARAAGVRPAPDPAPDPVIAPAAEADVEPAAEPPTEEKRTLLGALGRLFGAGGDGAAEAPDVTPPSAAAGTGDEAAAPAPEPTARTAVPRQPTRIVAPAPEAPGAGDTPGRVVILRGTEREVTQGPAGVLSAQGERIGALLGEDSGARRTAAAEAPAVPPAATLATPAPEAAADAPAPGARQLALGTEASAPAAPASAPEPRVEAALRRVVAAPAALDVTVAGSAAQAVVLIVSPGGSGSGVVIDGAGHVLTTWHLVRGQSAVNVLLKAPGSGRADVARVLRARLIKWSRVADLALLRLDDPPPDLTPLPLAAAAALEPGAGLHALGHVQGPAWTDTPGTVAKLKPGSSWYSGHRLLHRGDVLRARTGGRPVSAGAAIVDARMQLVGIGAHADRRTGQLIAVSAQTIRDFLGVAAEGG